MKKITIETRNAFLNAKNFRKQNNYVEVDGNKTFLYLHNNLIAILDNGKLFIQNCGWFSNTTKERLNALPNVSIQQKNFNWYLNGYQWNGKLIEIK
jgi:hypothetical protein